jgi:hypothetical protein
MVLWDYGIFAHRKVLRSGNTEKFFVIVAYRKGKNYAKLLRKLMSILLCHRCVSVLWYLKEMVNFGMGPSVYAFDVFPLVFLYTKRMCWPLKIVVCYPPFVSTGRHILNSINQLIVVMVKCGVLFEVRTEFLNAI